MRLHDLFPNADQLVALSPGQLAHALLRALHQEKTAAVQYVPGHQAPPDPPNYAIHDVRLEGYEQARHAEVDLAVREAWAWMQRELILVPAHGQPHVYFNISRFGQTFLTEGNHPAAINARRLVDAELLHRDLHGAPIDNFWRADYDLSVLSAYRAVEIAVRTAGNFPQTAIGVPLMRNAFHPQTGALRDDTIPEAEREATSALFAGAIGLFKNANSHRYVQITASEAAALLVFASYLLGIVDERRAALQPPRH